MKAHYLAEISGYKNIYSLPNYWDSRKYSELLELMEYGDTSDLSEQELKEMCLMSISDNEPEEAAAIILKYVFKDELNAGQIDNLSHEMLNEKMWEEYADIKLHEKFFNAHQILFDAYNGKFPNTEAVTFNLKISSTDPSHLKIFKNERPEPAVVRLLINGMTENTLINRLYKDEISSQSFPEASDIIWQLKLEKEYEDELYFSILSSNYWFKDLKYIERFDANSHEDKIEIVDED